MQSINYKEIIEKSSLVALASPKEIKRKLKSFLEWEKMSPDQRHHKKATFESKRNRNFPEPKIKIPKAPAITWSISPQFYKGYNDPTYGSGVICNYLPEYRLYLSVIDLDNPKKDEDIAINDLLNICGKWICQTHTRRTPSGGYHIYFLSKQQPQLKEPSFNIDYQTNTGNKRGKYVVTNFRYATKLNDEIIDLNEYYKQHGTVNIEDIVFEKEYYSHDSDSPDEILIVDSIDSILSEIVEEIEKKGLWSPPVRKRTQIIQQNQRKREKSNKKELIPILQHYVQPGTRNALANALSGYLYKQNYSLEESRDIFEKVFHEDDELYSRLEYLENTYTKPKKEVAGIGALRELLSPMDVKKIQKLVEKKQKPKKNEIDYNIIDIDEKIGYYLEYDYRVTDKMIIESVEKDSTLFFESSSLNYYAQNGNGGIKYIDGLFVVNHCNELFGFNEISKKQCYSSLNFVTRPIKRETNVWEFKNGLLCLNTEDNVFQFLENTKCTNFIPKISFPFNWNPDADGGIIKESVYNILRSNREGFKDNINTYFKCLGHSFMGGIEKAIFPIIVGPPGTGKSTLLTILKRFLTYSEVPIPDIIKNDRFSLTPAVGKDINIDDDLQSGVWKGIGKLNTLISGNGGSVEIKGENERLELTPYNTPKLWGASNALPPVIGDGFQRRMILLLAENPIPPEEVNDSFQMDILNGIYDENLEWLVHEAFNKYVDVRGKPFITGSHKEAMIKEHESKSDPLKTGIEYIFKTSYDNFLEVSKVNRHIKNWFRYAQTKGMIFEEHRRPSVRSIKTAMDRAGYFQVTKAYETDNGNMTTYRAYEDIEVNPDWIKKWSKFEQGEDIL